MVEGNILHDLAIVIICAGIVTFVFRLLNLPLLLGYLISGVLVGPNFLAQSPIHDLKAIQSLSELGVIFLMFYIGLEFDLAKLKKIMGPAVIGVIIQTTLMMSIGILTASLLQWSSINGLFLGSLLAISSTMITIPILKENNSLKSDFAQVSIGILVLEDILAIIVLVVLTGVGINGYFAWGPVFKVVFLVGVFVVMVYFFGKLITPKLLYILKKFESSEILTIVTIALVLGVGELAHHYNFSIALGAFLAGSIISQQPLAIEIEHAIEPLRNLFTAIFFVTIGMQIDPKLLLDYWKIIFTLTFLVILGKTISIWIGLFLTGEKSKTAFRSALCKAQIGEFSFVIAALGIQYDVTESALMTLAVGVSLGSIILIPILFKNSLLIYNFLTNLTPRPLQDLAEFYSTFLRVVKDRLSRNTFLKLMSKPITYIIAYFLLFNGVIVIAFLSSQYIENNNNLIDYGILIKSFIWIFAALGCLPSLIAIIRNLDFMLMLVIQSVFNIKTRKQFTQGRLINCLNSGILCIVIIIFGGLYLSVAAAYLPSGVALTVFVSLVIFLSLFFWRHIIKINSHLEHLFIESFNTEIKNASIIENNCNILNKIEKNFSWPIILYSVTLKAESFLVGKKIRDIQLGSNIRIKLIGINRNQNIINNPSKEDILLVEDKLFILCNKNQEVLVSKIFEERAERRHQINENNFQIDQIYIKEDFKFKNQKLIDFCLNYVESINIIGIQRNKNQILYPSMEEKVKHNDILIIAGNSNQISIFKNYLLISK